ncbi:MAG: 1,4-dihydroxy-2-naphthoate polyprenyltransferase [Bacteroidota bacterium]
MANLKSWIVAARLRTLPLAFSSILVGSSLAVSRVPLDYTITGLTLLTAVLLQVLSNFANDYGDAVSGVDSDVRKGPSRMVQSGEITKEAMKRALITFTLLTLFSGVLLLLFSFRYNWGLILLFLLLGLAAIIASIKYTVGKNPYGYAGFGDVFVYLFFGLVSVGGTYFLQTQTFEWQVILPASSMGLFAVGVLNVNNIRDIESDKLTGKFSIPVRIGKKNAVIYHALLLESGLLLSVLFAFLNFQSGWSLIFLVVAIPLFLNIRAVRSKPASALDPYLKQMALSTLLFSVLFAIGQYLN